MTKTRRVQQVRELLGSQEFSAWYQRFESLHRDLKAVRDRDPELLMHLVLEAGEYENLAAQAETDYASLDSSFELLSAYEQQRTVASEAWSTLGSAEYGLADHRQAASELRAKLAAAQKKERSAATEAEEARLKAELEVEDKTVEHWAKQVEEARTHFDEESARRDELWQVVEEAWVKAFRANMARIEYAFLGKRARADVERLSQQTGTPAKEGEGSAADERARLESQIATLMEQAEKQFECVAIAEFLYWPHLEDMRAALCVPLVGDMHDLNIQVTKLMVYRVERAKGLKFIEPLPQVAQDADDDAPRLEAFFVDRPR